MVDKKKEYQFFREFCKIGKNSLQELCNGRIFALWTFNSAKIPSFKVLFSVVATIVIVLDQLMKWLIVKINPQWDGSFLNIHLVTNTGAGFGILQDKTSLLAMFSFLVALVIIWNYRKIPRERFAQFCVALFLGGVLGNFIDRAFRGHVIDFIDLKFWPAFNVADMAISIAVAGLIWYSWKENRNGKKIKKE